MTGTNSKDAEGGIVQLLFAELHLFGQTGCIPNAVCEVDTRIASDCAAVLLNRRHGQARSVDEVSSQEGGRGDKRRESGLETHGTRSEKKTDEEKAMAIFIKADRGMFCARQFTPCGRKVCAVKIIWPYYIIYFPF